MIEKKFKNYNDRKLTVIFVQLSFLEDEVKFVLTLGLGPAYNFHSLRRSSKIPSTWKIIFNDRFVECRQTSDRDNYCRTFTIYEINPVTSGESMIFRKQERKEKIVNVSIRVFRREKLNVVDVLTTERL